MEKAAESEVGKPEAEGELQASAQPGAGEVGVVDEATLQEEESNVVEAVSDSGPNNPLNAPEGQGENTEEGDPASTGDAVEEQSSTIEMEVDDSNTGDTITSNPEIDLGSAAAAATAVIIEEPDADKVEEEEEIVMVSSSMERVVSLDAEAEAAPSSSSGLSEEKPPSEEVAEELPASKDGSDTTINEISSPTGSPAVNEEPSASVNEILQPASPDPEEQEDIFEEAMDTSEDASLSATSAINTEIAEPVAVVLESGQAQVSVSELEHDMIEAAEPESDSAFENEPEEFLQDEDSMTSLPEDAVEETDKEILTVADLVGEDLVDDDDEETYLEITRRRISQDREGNCYCGKDRNFNIPELLCASCYRWYHESCISYQLGKLVPFTTNYVFTCKNCSPTGLECFRRNQAQFFQMCVTALANLTQASAKEGKKVKLFSKDKDIIPFFEMHWEALTTTTRRLTQSWHSTVTKTLIKDAGTVYTCQEVPDDEFSPYFGLVSDDLTQIRPNYEAMIKSGQLKITDSRNSSSALRGRGAKRRTVDPCNVVPNQLTKKPRGESFGPKPSIGHGYPTEHPFNKDSYRYILAEPDPNAPYRQEFDESNEWSGKPIHGWLCRVVNPPSVLLALHDRAPQLKVSDDRLSVTGDKGYCMIRATHGITRGSWYYEAKITDMPEGSATRIGFCQQFGNLQGPLGFDRYGYSWRSRYGTTFHEARGRSYAKGGYGLGDVLGFLIVLPEETHIPSVPTSFKDRPLVKVKSHLYYEDKDEPKEMEKKDPRKGSKIICFKNGVCQGVAFEDIYCGTYYPTLSLYKSITVRVNFGPDFEAPPTDTDLEYHGMHERVEGQVIEQTMADLLYLTENEGRLLLDNAVPMPL